MSAILEKINDEEDEDLTEINEAAAFQTEVFELLEDSSSPTSDELIISLPSHLRWNIVRLGTVGIVYRVIIFFCRCASHTLNLIASVDNALSSFNNKTFPKKNSLVKAMGKMTGLWNKIGRSIGSAEQSVEAFG